MGDGSGKDDGWPVAPLAQNWRDDFSKMKFLGQNIFDIADCQFASDFADAGEELFSTGPIQSTTTGSISIPSSASEGITTMRVSMKYNGAPTSCEAFSYGEVEDYAVTISASGSRVANVQEEVHIFTTELYPNPAADFVNLHLKVKTEDYLQIQISDLNGRIVYTDARKAADGFLTTQLKTSTFGGGFYFVTVTGGGETFQGKLIVE